MDGALFNQNTAHFSISIYMRLNSFLRKILNDSANSPVMSEKVMSFVLRDSMNCLRLSCVVFDWRQVELISLEQFLRRSRSTSSAYKRYSDTELASDTVVLSSSTVTTPWFLSRFPYASSCRLRRVVRRGFSLTVEKIRFREKRKWIQDKNYLNQETLSGKFFLQKFANVKNINYFCN